MLNFIYVIFTLDGCNFIALELFNSKLQILLTLEIKKLQLISTHFIFKLEYYMHDVLLE